MLLLFFFFQYRFSPPEMDLFIYLQRLQTYSENFVIDRTRFGIRDRRCRVSNIHFSVDDKKKKKNALILHISCVIYYLF